MKRSILLAVLAPFTILAQSVKIATPSVFTNVYDTVYNVVAMPVMFNGKTAPVGSPVYWVSSNPSVVGVVTVPANTRQIALAGVSLGSAWVSATWTTASSQVANVNGSAVIVPVTVHDSVLITVGPMHLMTDSFDVVNQQGQYSLDITLTGVCWFQVTYDKHHIIHTGLVAGWSTSDTAWTRQLNSPPCSDTTVSPQRLPRPLPRTLP